MPLIYFITHPEVRFDWTRPVREWDLSDKGRVRLEKLAAQPWIRALTHLLASTEKKAVTAAGRLAEVTGLTAQFREDLGEIDRSRAPILSPEEYSKVTDQFFTKPSESAGNWEPAASAQSRIVQAVSRIIEELPPAAVAAIVSHGGVGTLLLCHLKEIAIAREQDQPCQGHYYLFDTTGKVHHAWHPIDVFDETSRQCP